MVSDVETQIQILYPAGAEDEEEDMFSPQDDEDGHIVLTQTARQGPSLLTRM